MFSSFSPYAKLHSCVDLRPGIYAMRKITYLCLFAPCSTRHNCVILCTYFVYFQNAQSYILARNDNFLTCAKLHICVISRHARNDKILQPYIHECAYEEGDTCIRCEQNTEYEQSLIADQRSATVCKEQPNEMDTQGNEQQLIAVDSSSTSYEEHIPLTLEEMRRQRVAYLSLSGNLEGENSDSTAEATELADTTQVNNENGNQE